MSTPAVQEANIEKGPGLMSGVMERVSNFASEHPVITAGAISLAGIGGGELATAGTAMADQAPVPAPKVGKQLDMNGNPLQEGATASASTYSSEGATATASSGSFQWTNLGGDPVAPNGAWTRGQFKHVMLSNNGRDALRNDGFNTKQIRAIESDVKQGDFRSCNMYYGEHFKRMAYHKGQRSEGSTTFLDPDYKNNPAPAWCLDAKVDLNGDHKPDEVIHLKVPKKCANAGLKAITPIHHPHHPKKHHPKKHAPVFVAKDALAENGQPLNHVPSDTFHALVKCVFNGKKVSNDLTINMGPHDEPVFALKCDVGKKVTAYEEDTTGPDQWKFLTNRFQKQTVRRHGNVFTFKDKEVPETPPQTPPTTTVPPKDGTQGPGAGTPGQPGGPGAGGQPSPSPNTVACYDPDTTTDGDMNPDTQGATMWGTAADQNDYCIGPADPA